MKTTATISELQEQVKDLLQKNVFLKQDQRNKILDKLPTLSEDQLQKIVETLQKGYESQMVILIAVVKENPNIVGDLKGKIKMKTIENIHTKEDSSLQEELSILQELENEFKNI